MGFTEERPDLGVHDLVPWVARSLDFGLTFQPVVRLPLPAGGYDAYNPALAISGDGTVIAATAVGSFYGHVTVWRSTDQGATFTTVGGESAPLADDFHSNHVWIGSAAGSPTVLVAYVCWDGIHVLASGNGGATFGPPAITPDRCAEVEGADDLALSATPAGNWVMAWLDRRGNVPWRWKDISLRVSRDAGTTWSPVVRANTVPNAVSSWEARDFTLTAVGNDEAFVAFTDMRGSEPSPRIRGGGFPVAEPAALTDARLDDVPSTVDLPASDGPVIASDGAGRLHVVFEVNDTPGTFTLYARTSVDMGRSFSPPVRVGQPSPHWHSSARLVARPDGRVYLAYVTYDPVAGRSSGVWSNRSLDSGRTWLESGVELGAQDAYIRPEIAASEGGVVHVTWRQGPDLIYARSSDDGEHFETRLVGSPASARKVKPLLCTAGNWVRWLWLEGYTTVKARSSPDRGATLLPEVVVAATRSGSTLALACDLEEGALAAWNDTPSWPNPPELWTAHVDGSVWDVPRQTSTSGVNVHAVGFPAASRLDVALAGTTFSTAAPVLAVSSDGGLSFPSVTVFSDPPSTHASSSLGVSLATDGAGSLWVSWPDGHEADYPSIHVRRSTDGGRTFSPPRRANTEAYPGCYLNAFGGMTALPGAAFLVWRGFRDSGSGHALFNADRLNEPPVAEAGEDRWLECEGELRATALLDGSASHDPDSTPDRDDIISWAWSEVGGPLAQGATATVPLTLGAHAITLTVTDNAGESDSDDALITVKDSRPPSGGITWPALGSCHGPAALPVTIHDDMSDTCDPHIVRSYEPGPGPEYAEHGDITVRLTARDQAGYAADGAVSFTVDTVSPTARFLNTSGDWMLPTAGLPLSVVLESSDEDGASGGVVHERLRLEDRAGGRPCTVYDGWSYGDRDGLLSDESITLDITELCRVATQCGFASLEQPVLRIEATDCGGNVGSGTRGFNGRLALRPGICMSKRLLDPGRVRRPVPLDRQAGPGPGRPTSGDGPLR